MKRDKSPKPCIVVCLRFDLERVKKLDFQKTGYQPIFAPVGSKVEVSDGNPELIYAFTKTASLASSFQATVLDLIPQKRDKCHQWLLNLDGENIPIGLTILQDLELGPPGLLESKIKA